MGTYTSTTPSWSALKRRDLRKNRRYAVEATCVRAAWLDTTGHFKMAEVRVLNVSESGMALELPEEPSAISMVRLESERHRLRGSGMIRHSRRIGSKFVVGIEFTEGLKWSPPPDSIPEPIPLSDPEGR